MKQPKSATNPIRIITSKKLWWFLHANRHRLDVVGVLIFPSSLTVGELGSSPLPFGVKFLTFLKNRMRAIAVTS
jgi:hypothetical protein